LKVNKTWESDYGTLLAQNQRLETALQQQQQHKDCVKGSSSQDRFFDYTQQADKERIESLEQKVRLLSCRSADFQLNFGQQDEMKQRILRFV